MEPYIYLRVLKHAEHTVFCVEDGQKTYRDPLFNGKTIAFSSGQQVKRSILQALVDSLGEQLAPITFNYNINKYQRLETKETWSPCDPNYVDQLLGGWMQAKAGDSITQKRRSPLSISAMRPLHPLLVSVYKEDLTFDRSDWPDNNPIIVRMEGRDEPLTEEEIEAYLLNNNRTIPRRAWIRENSRTTGLFVFDVAIDLRRLFSVSTNQHEPEISTEMIEALKGKGWFVSKNVFGECLVMPKERRDEIIPALAHALLNWRITSNQARTFSLMETLAVAISDNANTIPGAIRAKLIDEGERPTAKPIIDETAGADVFVTLPCASYIVTESESADALNEAEKKLIQLMNDFDYEKQ